MTRRSPRRRPGSGRRRPGPTIVSGELGGRRIESIDGTTTRPTTSRVREAIFNSLESRGVVVGARVLDGFAGTGALAIEALSRGADSAVLIELDRQAAECCRHNLAALGLDARGSVVEGDAVTRISALPRGSADLVLLDPPYRFDAWGDLLSAVEPVLAPEGVICVESGSELEPFEDLEVLRSRRYGSSWVTLLGRQVVL